jgi:two-component system chemotaxis sensor kinase CheA
MTLPISAHSEALAKAIVLSDPAKDPAAFEVPLAAISALAQELSWSPLADLCRQALEALRDLRPGADGAACLDRLELVVMEAASLADRLARGQAAEPVPLDESSQDDGSDGPVSSSLEIEPELLELFLSGADENLSGIERNLLELEKVPQRQDLWAELRRQVHTLKGECGVLSLGPVQVVLHEAESYLDRIASAGVAEALDPCFPLVDWLRSVLACIRSRTDRLPDGAAELRACFQTGSELSRPASEPPTRLDRNGPVAGQSPRPSKPIVFAAEVLQDEALPDFINEARQHLESAEAALLALERQPDDPEPLNVVFRAFHTIKGVAGFLNLGPIVRLAHSTETLMDEARKGRRLSTPAHIGLILASNDATSRLLGALTGAPAPEAAEIDLLIDRIDAATRGDLVAEPTPISPRQQAQEPIVVQSGEEIESVAKHPATAVKRIGEVLLARSALSLQDLQFALARQEQLNSEGRPAELGDLLVELGLIQRGQLEEALASEGRLSPIMKSLENSANTPPLDVEMARKLRVESTVMVATQRLDMLVDMVGELVIAQQMIVQDPQLGSLHSETLSRNLTQVSKITRDLQEASMSLRMVTFKSTFQKMSRLVRDVAVKSGRDVVLTINGADTEVDRTVVEKVSDPLIHILRNAIDHGLEKPDERRAVGKSEKGQLWLEAYTKSGSIIIEVRDDGRGICRDKIIAKAIAVGLISDPQRAQDLSENEVFKLIFTPGFSTAEKVTNISGRGVGLDVVKRNIESMRGKIEIASKKGFGTIFTLKLPLTLAIIDGMIVRCGSERYVLPTLSIVQSFRPSTETLHRVLSRGELIEVRGRLVPVFSLADVLRDRSGSSVRSTNGILVLIESTGGQICVLVDAILGQQQVVIKSLGKSIPSIEGISGGAILGDGQVALIVDVERVISRLTLTIG